MRSKLPKIENSDAVPILVIYPMSCEGKQIFFFCSKYSTEKRPFFYGKWVVSVALAPRPTMFSIKGNSSNSLEFFLFSDSILHTRWGHIREPILYNAQFCILLIFYKIHIGTYIHFQCWYFYSLQMTAKTFQLARNFFSFDFTNLGN